MLRLQITSGTDGQFEGQLGHRMVWLARCRCICEISLRRNVLFAECVFRNRVTLHKC